ncbi:MAG: class II aldolase/adducin family protein, partial [Candidatus Omnitrophota bacterium]
MKNLRKKLSYYGNLIIEKKLTAGAGGNISARDGKFIYLSPSGFCLDEIKENQWVKVDLETGKIYGKLKPTCEISMHIGIYSAREDVNAVVHTHPPITIGLISAGVKFKPVFPDFVSLLGEEIPVIEYVTPGGGKIREKV